MNGKIAAIARAAPRSIGEVTADDLLDADTLRDRWRAIAPGAVCLLDDPAAWARVSTAWAHWLMSQRAAAQPLLDIRTADLFGASKGAGRHRPGLFDRIGDLAAQLSDLEEDATRVHMAFALAGDHDVRTAAYEAFELISVAVTAMKAARERASLLAGVLDRPAGGQGSMTRRLSIPFDYVADEVVSEWRRLGLAVPASNSLDGGLVDLLHAMHREAQGRDVPEVATLMARLRKGRRGRDPNIPHIGGGC